jgi:hypothetical protein
MVAASLAVPSAADARPRLKLSDAAGVPGERIRLVGHGFPTTARLRVVLGGRTVRRTRIGRRGGFRLAFRVPSRAAGSYRLTLHTRDLVVRRRFRIRARARTPAPAPTAVPVPAAAPPPPPAQDPRLVAAGDIACRPELAETPTSCRHARTADLAESLAPDAVAVLGDAQYEHGELANFQTVYGPTWGRLAAITHPAAGNHEYEGDPERDEAPGYFAYFGAAAAGPNGFYRWTLGSWTLLVMNSGAINWTRATGGNPALPDDCWPVSCAVGSPQELWLRSQLEGLPDAACVLAYWHHPRFSSGFGGAAQPHPETAPLFQALYDHGVELLLSGHSHNYERFEPVAPPGTPAPAGVTQFVVGTGGRGLHTDTGPQGDTSDVLRTDAFGVLELTLHAGSYSFRFIREDGAVLDQGSAACHGRATG